MVDKQQFRLVDMNGKKFAVRETGAGENTVFLFHGVTANHQVWHPIQDALSEKYRVISVDQRGHGNSFKPEEGYTAREFSDDIIGLLRQLGSAGVNVLVGHSLGSRNAIVAASRFPDEIKGIIGVDFTPFIEDEVFNSLEARVNSGDRDFDTLEEVEEYLQKRYVNIPPSAIARRASYGYAKTEAGKYRPLADGNAMVAICRGLREELATALSAVNVPAILVRGAESTLVTEVAFQKTRELRPDLEYVVVENADHYVPEEQPETITKLIDEFVTKLL